SKRRLPSWNKDSARSALVPEAGCAVTIDVASMLAPKKATSGAGFRRRLMATRAPSRCRAGLIVRQDPVLREHVIVDRDLIDQSIDVVVPPGGRSDNEECRRGLHG